MKKRVESKNLYNILLIIIICLVAVAIVLFVDFNPVTSPSPVFSSDNPDNWGQFGKDLNNSRITSAYGPKSLTDIANYSYSLDQYIGAPLAYNGYVYLTQGNWGVNFLNQINLTSFLPFASFYISGYISAGPIVNEDYVYIADYYNIHILNSSNVSQEIIQKGFSSMLPFEISDNCNKWTSLNLDGKGNLFAFLKCNWGPSVLIKLNATNLDNFSYFLLDRYADSYSSFAITDKYIYFGAGNSVYQLNNSLGLINKFTQTDWSFSSYSGPLIYENYIYFAAKKLYKLGLTNLELIDSSFEPQPNEYSDVPLIYATPVAYKDYLYVTSINGVIYQLKRSDMSILKTYTTNGFNTGQNFILSHDILYFSSIDTIYRFNASTFDLIDNYSISTSDWRNSYVSYLGVISSGFLFSSGGKGIVYRFGNYTPYAPLSINFVSPENITYGGAILINLSVTGEPSSVWWNNGTENLSYSGEVLVNLDNGQYTFYAWANNDVEEVLTNVTFIIGKCGNDILDLGEECDGANIPLNCSALGFNSGSLFCDNNCKLINSCTRGGGGGGDTPLNCTDTCFSKGFNCGNQFICGKWVNCGVCIGACTLGQCFSIENCTETCASKGFNCGTHKICNKNVDCGTCASGVCTNGVCVPVVENCTETCSNRGFQCGTQTICNGSVNCGVCPVGKACSLGACIELPCGDSCAGLGFSCGIHNICDLEVDCGVCVSPVQTETPKSSFPWWIFLLLLLLLLLIPRGIKVAVGKVEVVGGKVKSLSFSFIKNKSLVNLGSLKFDEKNKLSTKLIPLIKNHLKTKKALIIRIVYKKIVKDSSQAGYSLVEPRIIRVINKGSFKEVITFEKLEKRFERQEAWEKFKKKVSSLFKKKEDRLRSQ